MEIAERWQKQFDFLIKDGCRPIDVRIVKKLCMGFLTRGDEKPPKFSVFYCSRCRLLHEEQTCPKCGSNVAMSAEETEAIVLKE